MVSSVIICIDVFFFLYFFSFPKMASWFGKKKKPEELLRQNQRALNKVRYMYLGGRMRTFHSTTSDTLSSRMI